jgi:Right handed beta helix region
LVFAASLAQAASFDITQYGAVGNGTTLASAAINKPLTRPAWRAEERCISRPALGFPAPFGSRAMSHRILNKAQHSWQQKIGILATAVDNLTIDNVKIDTNRDGMNIASCRNVRISNCSVNTPYDDGICLKGDYATGFARATENVTITNCQVSGYDNGTFLDSTYQRKTFDKPNSAGLTGGSSSGQNRMADSRTSRFRIACSTGQPSARPGRHADKAPCVRARDRRGDEPRQG